MAVKYWKIKTLPIDNIYFSKQTKFTSKQAKKFLYVAAVSNSNIANDLNVTNDSNVANDSNVTNVLKVANDSNIANVLKVGIVVNVSNDKNIAIAASLKSFVKGPFSISWPRKVFHLKVEFDRNVKCQHNFRLKHFQCS